MDTKQLVLTILGIIFAFYIVINALVPQLSGWAAAISCVDATDYGWTVYLVFLVIALAIAYDPVKKLMGKT